MAIRIARSVSEKAYSSSCGGVAAAPMRANSPPRSGKLLGSHSLNRNLVFAVDNGHLFIDEFDGQAIRRFV